MSFIEAMQQMNEKMEELKARMNEQFKAKFKEAVAGLFEKYPDLEEFSWTQFTPYFNDGEPCYFRVNEYSTEVNGHDEDETERDWEEKAIEDVVELLECVDPEVMESAFGDHVRVRVTKDGVETDDYSHHD